MPELCFDYLFIFVLLFFFFFSCADMERRDLSHKEKLYLREQNVITETQCTLGTSQPLFIYAQYFPIYFIFLT